MNEKQDHQMIKLEITDPNDCPLCRVLENEPEHEHYSIPDQRGRMRCVVCGLLTTRKVKSNG